MMNIAILGFVGVVLLCGLVAFGVGHKNWSWGTIVAGVLVLLSATGYLYLVARVAQRENVWRKIITDYQTKIVKVRDAMVPGANGILVADEKERSLAALTLQRARWRRALERVNTWRDRHWDNVRFKPPTNDAPGQIIIAFETDTATAAPINAGAELSIFDATPIEEGGVFVGVFRVREIETSATEKTHTLKIEPAAEPTDADKTKWSKDYAAVSLYENLPVDRWLAYYQTKADPDFDLQGAYDAATTDGSFSKDRSLLLQPNPNKIDAEKILKDLESDLEYFKKHEGEIPEDEWRALADARETTPLPLGSYWATVEFKEPHEFPPLAGQPNADPMQYESGDTIELDLETAVLLGDSTVTIKRVVFRRALSDAFTSLRGGDIPLDKVADNKPGNGVQADGMIFIRKRLRKEIDALEQATNQLIRAKTNTDDQSTLFKKERVRLEKDLASWQKDIATAADVERLFKKQVGIASGELEAAQRSVVRFGKELDRVTALLAGQVNRQAPAPLRPTAPSEKTTSK